MTLNNIDLSEIWYSLLHWTIREKFLGKFTSFSNNPHCVISTLCRRYLQQFSSEKMTFHFLPPINYTLHNIQQTFLCRLHSVNYLETISKQCTVHICLFVLIFSKIYVHFSDNMLGFGFFRFARINSYILYQLLYFKDLN